VLRAVGVQVHFLVWVLAEVVRGHVSGDHHHGNAVEGRVGDTGRGIGEPWAKMREQHRSLAGDPRVAVGRVRGNLLVAHVDEVDRTRRHRREHGNVGVAAQPEYVAHAAFLEVAHQVIRNGVFHHIVSVL
jgi:hypothetical protein